MGNNKNKRLPIAQRRDLVARKAEERVRRQEEVERYIHFLFCHILTAFKYPISFGISLSLSCKQVSSSSNVNS